MKLNPTEATLTNLCDETHAVNTAPFEEREIQVVTGIGALKVVYIRESATLWVNASIARNIGQVENWKVGMAVPADLYPSTVDVTV